MRVGDVEKKLLERMPAAWAEAWDNVGLIVGDPSREAARIAVSLDATERSVRRADEMGCELLITHHPAIFEATRRAVMPDPTAAMLRAALSCGVSVISLHTNWDSSPEGVNVLLASSLGMTEISPLARAASGAWGMGAVGKILSPTSVETLARAAKREWGLSWALVSGDAGRTVRRAALCGGAGGSLISAAAESGADVYITADLSYHHQQAAEAAGLALIICGHGEMEAASMPRLAEIASEITGIEVRLIETPRTPLVMI